MTTKNITLGIAVVATLLSSCSSSVPEKPVQGKIKKEIISFTPKVTGRILKIYVQEGDLVHTGDTLAMLDVPEVDAKLAQVSGVVKAATAQKTLADNGATENQRKQLKAKLNATKEQFMYAEKSYNRSKAMFDDGLIAPQQFDEITAKYNAAKEQQDAVQAEWNEVEKGVRYETKDAAAGQQQQALGVLQEVEIAYSEKYIIATNTMEIETITLHEGELATAGFALFNGYIPNSTYFRMTIGEKQIGNFPKGKELTLEIPYLKQEIKVKVQNIKQLARYADVTSPYPNLEMDEAFYELKLIPADSGDWSSLLVNASVLLKK
ncbi:MAG: biotin/lipoyl-binding protein [Flavobacteriia bacterium]|nr:biotin/lipoyl-binding protein [Flavobacteriia bacterium]OJX39157.1 MAG: hypothetical protein BGO87_04010 [Flavobacteriia bacterium 40-80]